MRVHSDTGMKNQLRLTFHIGIHNKIRGETHSDVNVDVDEMGQKWKTEK